MADIDAQVDYHGSCQCGQVAFKVSLSVALESPQSRITNCDCSICTRNAYHIVYVPRLSVIWIRGWDKLKNFRFNKKSVDHKFCPDCGSSVVIDPCCFYKDMDGFQDGPDVIGLNVRMLEGVDINKLTFSGEGIFASLREMMASISIS